MQEFAGIAQLVEQLICNHQVAGSIPAAGTIPRRRVHDKFLISRADPVLGTDLPEVGKPSA
jgi:hypothetical protein